MERPHVVPRVQKNADPRSVSSSAPTTGAGIRRPLRSTAEEPPFIRQVSMETWAEWLTDTSNAAARPSVSVHARRRQPALRRRRSVTVNPIYERLERNFLIGGVTLPLAAAYQYTRYSANVSTANRRACQAAQPSRPARSTRDIAATWRRPSTFGRGLAFSPRDRPGQSGRTARHRIHDEDRPGGS
jgi:hypothetical protein